MLPEKPACGFFSQIISLFLNRYNNEMQEFSVGHGGGLGLDSSYGNYYDTCMLRVSTITGYAD